MIAHNRFLDKDDYEKGKQLCVKLDKTIEEAINQTDSIEIKSENKDSVKEVGDYKATIKLHKEVTVEVPFTVVSE